MQFRAQDSRSPSMQLIAVCVALLTQAAPSFGAETTTYKITADEMCCQGCAKKVAAQLYTAPGVLNVASDVESRLVTVTAKSSDKLTLDRLWHAVEKAKGKPSRLVAPNATVSLVRNDQLQPEFQTSNKQYVVRLPAGSDVSSVSKLSSTVQAMKGVRSVALHQDQSQIVIETSQAAILSPWPILSAAGTLGLTPVSVIGPFGQLTVESTSNNANVSSRVQNSGGVR